MALTDHQLLHLNALLSDIDEFESLPQSEQEKPRRTEYTMRSSAVHKVSDLVKRFPANLSVPGNSSDLFHSF